MKQFNAEYIDEELEQIGIRVKHSIDIFVNYPLINHVGFFPPSKHCGTIRLCLDVLYEKRQSLPQTFW